MRVHWGDEASGEGHHNSKHKGVSRVFILGAKSLIFLNGGVGRLSVGGGVRQWVETSTLRDLDLGARKDSAGAFPRFSLSKSHLAS